VHQVFVSHAKEDQDAASRVCEMLEADGVGCWLASRDATPGKDGAAEILEAIGSSDLVLLVFSAAANDSADVLREMEGTVASGRPVLPVRLDDATPNISLQRYLDLASQRGAIVSPETAKEPELGSGAEAARLRRPSRRTWVIVGGAALLVIAVGLGLGLAGAGDRVTWTELSPPVTPPPLTGFGAYVPSTGRLIVFGGEADTGVFDDAWTYDPVANYWNELDPSGAVLPPREYESVAYDPITRRVIMFGGLTGANNCLNETWAYDPYADAWTNLHPAGALPAARAWGTMVCDPDTGKLIMFGGMTGGFKGRLVPRGQLSETWAYDPAANTWTQLEPAGAIPAARFGHSMAYDPSTHKVILFGGASSAARFNDTWAYDPSANTWTELDPAGALPSARGGHSMAYDPTSERLIMFGGGVSETELFNDTWAYDPVANSWTELKPSGTVPPPRALPSITYDPNTRRLIMFGGADDTGVLLNDTWALTS
jgi:N-acetylneuraminic acid mutarotase